jgi:hypothetical protein
MWSSGAGESGRRNRARARLVGLIKSALQQASCAREWGCHAGRQEAKQQCWEQVLAAVRQADGHRHPTAAWGGQHRAEAHPCTMSQTSVGQEKEAREGGRKEPCRGLMYSGPCCFCATQGRHTGGEAQAGQQEQHRAHVQEELAGRHFQSSVPTRLSARRSAPAHLPGSRSWGRGPFGPAGL